MTFALVIAGVLVAAPPEPAGQLPLRLEAGQEFVYDASYTQTSARTGARFSRTHKVETFVMVLNQSGLSADVAFLTVHQPVQMAGEEPAVTARLEVGRVDGLGRIQFSGKRAKWPRVPMEGPPALETLEFPARPAALAGGQKWDDPEEFEFRLAWTVAGVTRYQQHQCVVLVGTHQYGDWQREDKVWVRLDGGFALRIERKIEQRTGDFSSTMVAELKSFNPFTLTESERSARRIEIQQCQRFADTLDELLLPRGEPDRRGYDDLLNLI
ncbi:MAG: hypothetical protein ACJ8F7_04195, partial [Gemmataceae bacterium]